MGTWHRGTTAWCRKSIPCMDPRPSRKWHESKMNAVLTPRVLRACTPEIVCLVCVEVDHRGYSRNSLSDETDVTFIWCYLIKTLYSDSTTQHNRHVPLDRYYLVIDNWDTSRTTFPPSKPTAKSPQSQHLAFQKVRQNRWKFAAAAGSQSIVSKHLAFRCVFGTHVQAANTCVSAQDFHGLSRAS